MMTGKSHFRVRGVRCGKCDRVHTWYKYRVWREGKKVKEEYIGKCDRYGNMERGSTRSSHKRQEQQEWANSRPIQTRDPTEAPTRCLASRTTRHRQKSTRH